MNMITYEIINLIMIQAEFSDLNTASLLKPGSRQEPVMCLDYNQ